MSRRSFVPESSQRRGTTLIEVAVIIALSAVITGIVVSGIAGIYRFNHSISEYSNGQQALQRFSSVLRSDIHRAENCRWTAGDQTLVLELADSRSLKYFKHKQRWVRSDNLGEETEQLMAFGLDISFVCECQVKKTGRGELVRLTLSNASREKNAQHSQTQRPLRCEIVAEVGRDYLHWHE